MVVVIAIGTALAWAGAVCISVAINISPLCPRKNQIDLAGVALLGLGLIMALAPGMIYWLVRGVFPY